MPCILQSIWTPQSSCLLLTQEGGVIWCLSSNSTFATSAGLLMPRYSRELMLVPEAGAGSCPSPVHRHEQKHRIAGSSQSRGCTYSWICCHRLVARRWAACSDLLSQAVSKGWVKPTIFFRLRLVFDVNLVAVVSSVLRVVLYMCFCHCGVTPRQKVHTHQSPVVWWWSQVLAPHCLTYFLVLKEF